MRVAPSGVPCECRNVLRLLPTAAAAALAIALAIAGPAAARPADVNVVNGTNNPLPVFSAQPLTVQGLLGAPVQTSLTGTPEVRPVPEYYRADGTLSASGTFGNCTTSLFTGVPAGRGFVLTNVEVDAQDTIRPEFIIGLRQQTGGGFFTHFMGVPLSFFSVNSIFSGTLALNDRVIPGSFTAGDISDVFVCLAPGSGDSATTGHYTLSGYLDAGGPSGAPVTQHSGSFRPRAVSTRK